MNRLEDIKEHLDYSMETKGMNFETQVVMLLDNGSIIRTTIESGLEAAEQFSDQILFYYSVGFSKEQEELAAVLGGVLFHGETEEFEEIEQFEFLIDDIVRESFLELRQEVAYEHDIQDVETLKEMFDDIKFDESISDHIKQDVFSHITTELYHERWPSYIKPLTNSFRNEINGWLNEDYFECRLEIENDNLYQNILDRFEDNKTTREESNQHELF